MKTKLRKYISGTVFTLLLPTSSLFAEEIVLDRIAAIVNEDVVMQSELIQRRNIVEEQLQARNTRLPSADILHKQVLNRLILESLQKQLAEKQGIRIPDSQLNAAISNIAAQNQMSFLNAEAGKQQTSAEYQLSHILLAVPSQASPELIQQAERKANKVHKSLTEGADFAEAAVEFSSAPNALKGGDLGWRKATELPENLGKAVRSLNTGDFSKPVRSPSGFHIFLLRDKRGGVVQLVEQRLVSHILLKPSEIRSPEQAQRQINQVYRRIQAGESFADMAKEFSDDPASGSEGGSLGWTQAGQMVPEFEEVMNNTPKGAVSRFGWHILTVLDSRTEDLGEEMQENRARAAIQKRKFNEELSTWLRELRSQAYVDIKG